VRIAHVIDYFHTDVGYQEFFLARCMAAAGHDVQVISSGHRHHTVTVPGADERAGAKALADVGVEVVRLPAFQLGHDRAWLKELPNALLEFEPEAVHVHGPFGPSALRVAAAKGRRHFALLVDNHLTDDNTPGAKSPLGRVAYRGFGVLGGPLLRARVDEWVAVGPDEARFLFKRLGLGRAQVTLVPLGFDPSAFSFDPARREALRARRGWAEDDLVVALSGKVHLGRRPDVVAAAVGALSTRRSVRLAVAGRLSPEDQRAIETAAGPLAGNGRCHFTGMLPQAELADLFVTADVVVFPHPPSISILEAAGTGARVWVEHSAYATWLHDQCAVIEPVDLHALPFDSADPEGRAERATVARTAFCWDGIGERFVSLYRKTGKHSGR